NLQLPLGHSLQKSCSERTADYLSSDVGLSVDKFWDLLHMLANDQADAAATPNPPARIRLALRRAHRRQARQNRERWMPPTPEQTNALEDLTNVESSVIAKVDWEYGRRDVQLPSDQAKVVDAKIEGLNLQA